MSKKSEQQGELPVKAIIFWSVILVIILTFFALLLIFRVKRVEVVGNCHYTDNAIESAVMGGPLSSNTLLLSTFNKHPSHEGADFIEDIAIDYVDRHTVRIRVVETKPIGAVLINGTYYYFNDSGTIIITSAIGENYGEVEETCDDGQPRDIYIIPIYEGLKIEDPEIGTAISTSNNHLFDMLKSISGMLNKNSIIPDKLIIENEETVTMICGTITVLLGKDDHMEDKLEELSGILPAAEGLTGTLHLEKFDGSQKRIIFDQAKDAAKSPEDELAAALAVAKANDEAAAQGAQPAEEGGDEGE